MKTPLPFLVVGVLIAGWLTSALAGEKPQPQKTVAKAAVRQSETSSTNVVKKRGYPVVGYLEGRGKTIILKSGPNGPLYSVKGEKGKLLFEDLTADQLRAQAPEIHQIVQSAVAVNSRNDASLRMIHR